MQRKKKQEERNRSFLGVTFSCCKVYTRIHINRKRDAYVGWCPKCCRKAEVKISPHGTKSRFFSAN
ncbi:TPA: hypothetical protein EYN65_11150 [Candidatus Poribacteria bacterium]|nr:hypothetical protein [Candidatus Poribacteria bacterium]HIO48447.1 hypothetical protein [Candidatus Poribacteria bacterium]